MDEEVRQFLKSASKLKVILETLKTISGNSSILEDLNMKLCKVIESVEREKSLNAGGKFEWVDSVLIKCLRNGDWLLIDNVNLCSAAVLDRLNALLEPKGVLTVSERGVGPDGKVVEIKPHKDFRLFLTMDPKNGEISRAMRNRGVEIHLMSFNDASEEKWDTLSLMDLEGLKDTKDMMALCRIETFLKDLILGEKPQLNELLKTASLIAQQLHQGTELKEAFCSAVIEVYYKSRSPVEFNCNNAFNVIHQEVNRIVDEAAKERKEEQYRSCVTLKTRNFERCSIFEKICQQGCILETSEKNLSYILASFFSVSSKNDLEARYHFLQNKVAKSWHPLISQLYEVTSSFNSSQDPDLPLDNQWLPDTTYAVNNTKINVLTFALLMACEYNVEKDTFNASKLPKKQITLLEYMHQKQKKIVEDRFNETIINEYLDLVRLYDDYVSNVVKQLDKLSLNDLVNMLYLLHWRFALQKCTLKPINKISTKEQYCMIVNLKVHYKWFYKFAVKQLELLTNIGLPQAFKAVLSRINKELDSFSMLEKITKWYRRQNSVPPPPVSKQQLDVITKYNRISRRFDVCDSNNDAVEILKFFESHKELRKLLVDFKSHMQLDFSGIAEKLNELVSINEMHLSEGPSANIDDNVLIPINLSGTWLLYTKTKDETLHHELSTSYYLYLTNSASVRPSKFLHKTEGEDCSKQALSDMTPKISYYVNSLLSNEDNGSVVKDCQKKHVTNLLSKFVTELAAGLSVDEPTISTIINKLEMLRGQDELSDPKEELLMLMDRLKKCAADIQRLSHATAPESIYLIADVYMEVGYVKATLNSKLPLIDPLAKKTLKKEHCADLMNRFTEMLQYYEKQNTIYNGSKETLHAICEPIREMIKNLKHKYEETYKYVAVRSEEVFYEAMLKEINFAFSTFLNPKHVSSSINKVLHSRISELLAPNASELVVDENEAIRELSQVESSVANYEMLVRGWSNFKDSYPDIIHPLLASLTEYLYGLKLKLALLRKLLAQHKYKKCLDVNIDEDLTKLCKFPVLDDEQNSYGDYVQMLTSSRMKDFVDYVLKNEDDVGISKRENLRLLKCAIQEAFNHCVIEYKGTDCMNRSTFAEFIELVDVFIYAWNKHQEEKEIQEKEAETELREMFPDYHTTDYSDFQKSLEFAEPTVPVEEMIKETVTYEDLKFVMNLHTTLVKNFTKSEWLNPDKNNHVNPDFLLPVLEKQKILEKTHHALDYRVDVELLGCMNVVLAVAQRYGDVTQITDIVPATRMLNKHSSDFYKDSNVEGITTLIDRIYSFDINSPISRYLTGFEILLSKCHEWEEVAHSGVSLSDFSKTLTEQIIHWRKLELNMWKDLLNKTYERMNEPISKWWLYMYNICDQFIAKSISETDLIQTLQTFITKSNLAEFQSRLDLLYVFHCHATQLPKSDEIQSLLSIFWNLHCYFEQYSLTIANKMKDLRSPIEKKLKDYVKIVRWKDINYWAIKETIDKSHRTLHKYMREFRDKIQGGEEGILSKAESYFLKSRKLCKETILATEYPALVQSLDGFVTEVIDTNQHLQNLEVDKSLPKEKQVSQAKSILQQKHRALADLFKNLNKTGLSYKTGILESKLKKPADDFVHRPIDLVKNFSHINHGRQEEKMLTIWNCCEMYYMRSQIRIDVLETALQNPSKDLGPQNIERCKGFSAHLLSLAQHQKQQLTQSSRLYYYLRYYLVQMNEFCEGSNFLHIELANSMMTFLKNATVVMNQYKIILNTCPSEDDFGSEAIEVPVLKFGAREGICYKYSNCWSETVALINAILTGCRKTSALLQKCKKSAPAVEYELVVPEFIPIPDFSELLKNLTSIKDRIRHLSEIFDNNSTTRSLTWLEEEVAKLIEQCQENKPAEISFEKCKKHSAKLTEEILVVIQNLYKKYSALEKVEKTKEGEEESVDLRDGNLKALLVENLASDVSTLEMKKILIRTHKLAKIVLSTSSQDIDNVKKITYQSMPLLEQLIRFYQYFITQQVAAYRVTCIEMSEDFEGKMQDVDKKDDEDDSDKSSDDDDDADEQMGETQKGADQLDQEIWGSDKEEEEGEQGAKEQNPTKDEQDKDGDDNSEEKEKSKKDINEMEEPEFDEDQVDPHHGDQKELPEPEPMDLPDDLQLDEGEQDDKQDGQEENPFDVDAMKEQNIPEEKEEEADKPDEESKDKGDEAEDFSSDDEDINKGGQDIEDMEQTEESEKKDDEDIEKGNQEADNAEKEEEETQNTDDTALDQTRSHQDNVEAMETDKANAADKTQATDSEVNQPNTATEDIQQEDQSDKDGAGQAQMEESTTGHSAATSAPQETKTSKREAEEEVKQKPGDSDSQRSLGDVDQPVKKKLKTVDSKLSKEQEPKDVEDETEQTAEMYEHIKEGQDSNIQVLDIATKEQAESQKKEAQHKDDEVMDEEEPVESSDQIPEEPIEEMEISDVPKEKSEKIEEAKEKQGKKGQHPEGDVLEEMKEVQIEGEVVQTSTVPRPTETTHYTSFTDLSASTASRLTMAEMAAIRGEVERQLAAWSDPPGCAEAERAWQKISSVTGGLAQELSEQLRLVLEPTLASRLKGDFRTGRRINMRKVIPYIASQFRKDKIWLRRTKPSKRDYQIVIAIDDSSSMADNHSKELAFESVALISKALTLLESGQLSVVSFGERVEVIHKLTEQFTDRSGTKLLQRFRFDQTKTKVGKLVDFVTEMFSQSQKQTTAANAKLLVIVSDGRGVFSEGESYVRQAVRRAKLADIFMVFVIVDNPESKSSVLDIRLPIIRDGKLLEIFSYMDHFPFSFYIILRDINSLPNVLSDALRQWFEIISNLDK
nr:unnamed protein product [Callosobruchus chinensis]